MLETLDARRLVKTAAQRTLPHFRPTPLQVLAEAVLLVELVADPVDRVDTREGRDTLEVQLRLRRGLREGVRGLPTPRSKLVDRVVLSN